VSDRYSEVAQALRVDVATAMHRAQRRYIMRLAASYAAVVVFTTGLVTAGALARKNVQSLADPWRLLLILLLWFAIAVAIYLIASLRRSTIVSPSPELERGRVGQSVWRSVARFAMQPAPTWVAVLAVAAVLIATGALAYDNWPLAAEWRVSSDLLVRLLLSAGALAAGFLARAAFRRWGTSAEDWERRRDRSVEQPDDLRAWPHTRPVEVAVEPVSDNTRTLAVRLEPHPDSGIQIIQTLEPHPDPGIQTIQTLESLPAGRGAAVTASIDEYPLSASVFLFERQDTGQALAEALDDHGVLRSGAVVARLATRIARQAAEDQIGAVADGLLNLDLGDLVIAGWRKQERLAAAAQRTAANPGSAERIELATHRISSIHRPSVELLLNDTHLTEVNFELDVEFVIKALEVTVREGRVVSLHAGECDVSAVLAAEGIRLASRQRTYELPLVVRWPLLLHADGGADPLPYGATSPLAAPPPTPRGSSPSTALSPPRRRRSLISSSLRRQRRDERDEPGRPAD